MNYKEYMNSEWWKQKRDSWIRYIKVCEAKVSKNCKGMIRFDKELDEWVTDGFTIHHIDYKTLGNEKREDILCVCWSCHNKIHENDTQRRS